MRRKLVDLAWAAPLAAWYARNAWRASHGLLASARELVAGAGVLFDLQFAARLGGILFCGSLVALLVLRMPPKSITTGWAPRAAALLGTFLVTGFESLPFAQLSASAAALSAILIASGFTLMIVVLAWLGRSFSIVPEARGLKTSGPYALSRHPLYVVEEIARIDYEEDILRAAFGAAFDDYARGTALLLPGLRLRRS